MPDFLEWDAADRQPSATMPLLATWKTHQCKSHIDSGEADETPEEHCIWQRAGLRQGPGLQRHSAHMASLPLADFHSISHHLHTACRMTHQPQRRPQRGIADACMFHRHTSQMLHRYQNNKTLLHIILARARQMKIPEFLRRAWSRKGPARLRASPSSLISPMAARSLRVQPPHRPEQRPAALAAFLACMSMHSSSPSAAVCISRVSTPGVCCSDDARATGAACPPADTQPSAGPSSGWGAPRPAAP